MLASSYLTGLDYRLAFLLNTFISDKQKSSADHDYKPDAVSTGISGNNPSFVLRCTVQYSLQRCPCTIVTSSDRNIGAAAITPTT